MEKRKFLVVVDPSHERHLALERMIDIATQRREWIADFHLLVGFEGADKADPEAPSEVIRGKKWFDQLLAPVDELGVDYTVEFFWTGNWRKSITDAADRGQRFDEEAMVAGFHRMLASMGDRDLRVDLVLVPDRVRGERGRRVERFGHDRHLRFGERAALALGAGMQSFATSTFRETVTVARLPIADAKAREERAVRSAVRPPVGGWLG